MTETVCLETIDGVPIEADVIRSHSSSPAGTLVIGHPHPLYGGDRHNHVVGALQRVAFDAGMNSIAVDFRGVGNSGGMHDDGDSERLDLAAACELSDLIEPDSPIVMAGYSFGAVVGLNVSHPWICGWLAVAPPLAMMSSRPTAATNARPKVLLLPEHDQFTAPREMVAAVESWPNTHTIVMPGVDHFLMADAPRWCGVGLTKLVTLGAFGEP